MTSVAALPGSGNRMSTPATSADRPPPSVIARVLMGPIKVWQRVSRWLPPRCRFHPSCSQYALEALELHGAGRGSALAVRRVARCHPWHPGGVDHVPEPNTRSHPPVVVTGSKES